MRGDCWDLQIAGDSTRGVVREVQLWQAGKPIERSSRNTLSARMYVALQADMLSGWIQVFFDISQNLGIVWIDWGGRFGSGHGIIQRIF